MVEQKLVSLQADEISLVSSRRTLWTLVTPWHSNFQTLGFCSFHAHEPSNLTPEMMAASHYDLYILVWTCLATAAAGAANPLNPHNATYHISYEQNSLGFGGQEGGYGCSAQGLENRCGIAQCWICLPENSTSPPPHRLCPCPRKQIFVFSVTRCGEFWREAKGGSSCNNRTSSRRQVWNGPLFHCSRFVCVCEAVWGHQPYSQLWVHRTSCRLPWASSTWHAVCRTISSNHRFPICRSCLCLPITAV